MSNSTIKGELPTSHINSCVIPSNSNDNQTQQHTHSHSANSNAFPFPAAVSDATVPFYSLSAAPLHSSAATFLPLRSSATVSLPLHNSAAATLPFHSSAATSLPLHMPGIAPPALQNSGTASFPLHSSAATSLPTYSSATSSVPFLGSTTSSFPLHNSIPSSFPSHNSATANSFPGSTNFPHFQSHYNSLPFQSTRNPQTAYFQQMQLMSNHLLEQDLIKKSIEKFGGTPTKFWSWVGQLESYIGTLNLTPLKALQLISSYCTGEPQKMISRHLSAVQTVTHRDVNEIWENLIYRFGSSQGITRELMQKIREFNNIQAPNVGDQLLSLIHI